MNIHRIELWSRALMRQKKLKDEFSSCFNPIRKMLLFFEMIEASSEVERLRPVRSQVFLEDVTV